VLDFLREHGVLRLTMAAAFLGVGGAAVAWAARRGAGPREWATLLAAGGIYAGLAASMEIVQERAHLAEYGILALLFREALAARAAASGAPAAGARARVGPGPGACLLTAAAGWSDELVQAVLPNRVYDLRDVGFNTMAGALAVAAATVLAAARARDRRGRGGGAPGEEARPE
jgi:VanZ family protein